MSRRQKIVEIVQRVSKNDVAPDPEESLFDSGYLDSFALTDMVAEIEQEFGISIPDADLTPRRFDSVERIESYIEAHAS
jgi:D-alanine--poly(phosphoribitol) ligase subunit 2